MIWDYRRYFAQAPILTLSPDTVRSWKYHSTMQGTYTGVKSELQNPKTKKMVDVLVGTEERLYKTNQKADNEAEAKLIGEGVLLQANRKSQYHADHYTAVFIIDGNQDGPDIRIWTNR